MAVEDVVAAVVVVAVPEAAQFVDLDPELAAVDLVALVVPGSVVLVARWGLAVRTPVCGWVETTVA